MMIGVLGVIMQNHFVNHKLTVFTDEMLQIVGEDDVQSFKSGNEWLANHPKEALFFSDLASIWDKIRTTYNADFKALVYGKLPKDDDVFESLKQVRNRIQDIEWSVQP